ncbi:hypothetical protein JAAARDRAFT_193522 [Jaapia argillacea MUCL 33604]|uniref:Ribonuclease H1 N-terminal domain-containing protein n=1 Tax=Jaapia argillacea MUCL 33604 TaxID=933084 RepID=A0A067PTJ8_9AGAM|nr:hypothetical protein JAAARDRAFT_193522 [Jaapia argillacea MUCL 33604]
MPKVRPAPQKPDDLSNIEQLLAIGALSLDECSITPPSSPPPTTSQQPGPTPAARLPLAAKPMSSTPILPTSHPRPPRPDDAPQLAGPPQIPEQNANAVNPNYIPSFHRPGGHMGSNGKSYSVERGHEVGVTDKWFEACRATDGHPQPSYRSFRTSAPMPAQSYGIFKGTRVMPTDNWGIVTLNTQGVPGSVQNGFASQQEATEMVNHAVTIGGVAALPLAQDLPNILSIDRWPQLMTFPAAKASGDRWLEVRARVNRVKMMSYKKYPTKEEALSAFEETRLEGGWYCVLIGNHVTGVFLTRADVRLQGAAVQGREWEVYGSQADVIDGY